jgi:hypothetical protein
MILRELRPRRAELMHRAPRRQLRRLVDGFEHTLRQARGDERGLISSGDRLPTRKVRSRHAGTSHAARLESRLSQTTGTQVWRRDDSSAASRYSDTTTRSAKVGELRLPVTRSRRNPPSNVTNPC